MCLYVKEDCTPRIAEKDILCYKVVRFDNGHSWVSPYMLSKQAYNKVLGATMWNYTSPITSLKVEWREIRFGFHAWTNEVSARFDMKGFIAGFIAGGKKIYAVRLAIIPAGAEYCLGKCSDIVATKMIVFGSKTAYQKYLAAKK